MHVILRPGVVLLAAFALVLVGAGVFMARFDGASAAGGGPEMRLTANGCTAECSFATGESFTLAVDIVTAPANGYVGVQSVIDYGDDLIYDIDGQPAETEIVWADVDTRVALSGFVGPGRINHGGLTGLTPPLPVSTYTGIFVEIKMTCSVDDTSTQVDLLPLGDRQAITSGAGFVERDMLTQIVAKVRGLLIHCGAGGPLDTPTPTAPPTSTPRPMPTPGPTSTLGPGLLLAPTLAFGGSADVISTSASVAALPSTGDGTCSNTFNAVDATLTLRLHSRLISPLVCPRDSDANSDGLTNSVDAALIMQYAAGFLPTLPP